MSAAAPRCRNTTGSAPRSAGSVRHMNERSTSHESAGARTVSYSAPSGRATISVWPAWTVARSVSAGAPVSCAPVGTDGAGPPARSAGAAASAASPATITKHRRKATTNDR